MSSILILLALSALSGFVLEIGRFSWPAILAAGGVLAPLSTVVLQNQDFDTLRTDLSSLYLSNEPTTNHTMVATTTFAVNTSGSRTVNSSWPNSPISGRLI
jgi:hypothetical protein